MFRSFIITSTKRMLFVVLIISLLLLVQLHLFENINLNNGNNDNNYFFVDAAVYPTRKGAANVPAGARSSMYNGAALCSDSGNIYFASSESKLISVWTADFSTKTAINPIFAVRGNYSSVATIGAMSFWSTFTIPSRIIVIDHRKREIKNTLSFSYFGNRSQDAIVNKAIVALKAYPEENSLIAVAVTSLTNTPSDTDLYIFKLNADDLSLNVTAEPHFKEDASVAGCVLIKDLLYVLTYYKSFGTDSLFMLYLNVKTWKFAGSSLSTGLKTEHCPKVSSFFDFHGRYFYISCVGGTYDGSIHRREINNEGRFGGVTNIAKPSSLKGGIITGASITDTDIYFIQDNQSVNSNSVGAVWKMTPPSTDFQYTDSPSVVGHAAEVPFASSCIYNSFLFVGTANPAAASSNVLVKFQLYPNAETTLPATTTTATSTSLPGFLTTARSGKFESVARQSVTKMWKTSCLIYLDHLDLVLVGGYDRSMNNCILKKYYFNPLFKTISNFKEVEFTGKIITSCVKINRDIVAVGFSDGMYNEFNVSGKNQIEQLIGSMNIGWKDPSAAVMIPRNNYEVIWFTRTLSGGSYAEQAWRAGDNELNTQEYKEIKPKNDGDFHRTVAACAIRNNEAIFVATNYSSSLDSCFLYIIGALNLSSTGEYKAIKGFAMQYIQGVVADENDIVYVSGSNNNRQASLIVYRVNPFVQFAWKLDTKLKGLGQCGITGGYIFCPDFLAVAGKTIIVRYTLSRDSAVFLGSAVYASNIQIPFPINQKLFVVGGEYQNSQIAYTVGDLDDTASEMYLVVWNLGIPADSSGTSTTSVTKAAESTTTTTTRTSSSPPATPVTTSSPFAVDLSTGFSGTCHVYCLLYIEKLDAILYAGEGPVADGYSFIMMKKASGVSFETMKTKSLSATKHTPTSCAVLSEDLVVFGSKQGYALVVNVTSNPMKILAEKDLTQPNITTIQVVPDTKSSPSSYPIFARIFFATGNDPTARIFTDARLNIKTTVVNQDVTLQAGILSSALVRNNQAVALGTGPSKTTKNSIIFVIGLENCTLIPGQIQQLSAMLIRINGLVHYENYVYASGGTSKSSVTLIKYAVSPKLKFVDMAQPSGGELGKCSVAKGRSSYQGFVWLFCIDYGASIGNTLVFRFRIDSGGVFGKNVVKASEAVSQKTYQLFQREFVVGGAGGNSYGYSVRCANNVEAAGSDCTTDLTRWSLGVDIDISGSETTTTATSTTNNNIPTTTTSSSSSNLFQKLARIDRTLPIQSYNLSTQLFNLFKDESTNRLFAICRNACHLTWTVSDGPGGTKIYTKNPRNAVYFFDATSLQKIKSYHIYSSTGARACTRMYDADMILCITYQDTASSFVRLTSFLFSTMSHRTSLKLNNQAVPHKIHPLFDAGCICNGTFYDSFMRSYYGRYFAARASATRKDNNGKFIPAQIYTIDDNVEIYNVLNLTGVLPISEQINRFTACAIDNVYEVGMFAAEVVSISGVPLSPPQVAIIKTMNIRGKSIKWISQINQIGMEVTSMLYFGESFYNGRNVFLPLGVVGIRCVVEGVGVCSKNDASIARYITYKYGTSNRIVTNGTMSVDDGVMNFARMTEKHDYLWLISPSVDSGMIFQFSWQKKRHKQGEQEEIKGVVDSLMANSSEGNFSDILVDDEGYAFVSSWDGYVVKYQTNKVKDSTTRAPDTTTTSTTSTIAVSTTSTSSTSSGETTITSNEDASSSTTTTTTSVSPEDTTFASSSPSPTSENNISSPPPLSTTESTTTTTMENISQITSTSSSQPQNTNTNNNNKRTRTLTFEIPITPAPKKEESAAVVASLGVTDATVFSSVASVGGPASGAVATHSRQTVLVMRAITSDKCTGESSSSNTTDDGNDAEEEEPPRTVSVFAWKIDNSFAIGTILGDLLFLVIAFCAMLLIWVMMFYFRNRNKEIKPPMPSFRRIVWVESSAASAVFFFFLIFLNPIGEAAVSVALNSKVKPMWRIILPITVVLVVIVPLIVLLWNKFYKRERIEIFVPAATLKKIEQQELKAKRIKQQKKKGALFCLESLLEWLIAPSGEWKLPSEKYDDDANDDATTSTSNSKSSKTKTTTTSTLSAKTKTQQMQEKQKRNFTKEDEEDFAEVLPLIESYRDEELSHGRFLCIELFLFLIFAVANLLGAVPGKTGCIGRIGLTIFALVIYLFLILRYRPNTELLLRFALPILTLIQIICLVITVAAIDSHLTQILMLVASMSQVPLTLAVLVGWFTPIVNRMIAQLSPDDDDDDEEEQEEEAQKSRTSSSSKKQQSQTNKKTDSEKKKKSSDKKNSENQLDVPLIYTSSAAAASSSSSESNKNKSSSSSGSNKRSSSSSSSGNKKNEKVEAERHSKQQSSKKSESSSTTDKNKKNKPSSLSSSRKNINDFKNEMIETNDDVELLSKPLLSPVSSSSSKNQSSSSSSSSKKQNKSEKQEHQSTKTTTSTKPSTAALIYDLYSPPSSPKNQNQSHSSTKKKQEEISRASSTPKRTDEKRSSASNGSRSSSSSRRRDDVDEKNDKINRRSSPPISISKSKSTTKTSTSKSNSNSVVNRKDEKSDAKKHSSSSFSPPRASSRSRNISASRNDNKRSSSPVVGKETTRTKREPEDKKAEQNKKVSSSSNRFETPSTKHKQELEQSLEMLHHRKETATRPTTSSSSKKNPKQEQKQEQTQQPSRRHDESNHNNNNRTSSSSAAAAAAKAASSATSKPKRETIQLDDDEYDKFDREYQKLKHSSPSSSNQKDRSHTNNNNSNSHNSKNRSSPERREEKTNVRTSSNSRKRDLY